MRYSVRLTSRWHANSFESDLRDFHGRAEMLGLWNDLLNRGAAGKLTRDERQFFDKWSKAVDLLSSNPRHPGLNTHEIDDLTRKFCLKVWQSYLENRRSGARRMLWAYGPKKGQITILAVERHPDPSKSKSYKRVPLSRFPKSTKTSRSRRRRAGESPWLKIPASVSNIPQCRRSPSRPPGSRHTASVRFCGPSVPR